MGCLSQGVIGLRVSRGSQRNKYHWVDQREQFRTPTSVLGVALGERKTFHQRGVPRRRRWQGTQLTLSRRSRQRWLSRQTQKNRLNCSLRCVNRSRPIPARFQSSAPRSSGRCLAQATRSSSDGCSTSSILHCVARRSHSMPEHNVSLFPLCRRSMALCVMIIHPLLFLFLSPCSRVSVCRDTRKSAERLVRADCQSRHTVSYDRVPTPLPQPVSLPPAYLQYNTRGVRVCAPVLLSRACL